MSIWAVLVLMPPPSLGCSTGLWGRCDGPAFKKVYEGKQVLHGIDVEIADQQFVVIVGPSGCGKSTLLRMIAGLEEVTEGSIVIDGIEMNDTDPADRGCAMVFQNYALYPHMMVRQNVGYPLKIARVPPVERGRRVAEAAAILNLTDYLDRKPAQLSGGQRQRVAMGRAIVREPALFLFDEPLSNLDALLQGRIEITRLHKRLKATSVFVTHDQVEAMTLPDLLIVMNGGRVEQVGSLSEIYGKPASLYCRVKTLEIAVVLPAGDEKLEGRQVFLDFGSNAWRMFYIDTGMRIERAGVEEIQTERRKLAVDA